MDEIREIIVNLKIESKILSTLKDEILDACDLDYTGEDLIIRRYDKILTIIKTFYPDEYDVCLTQRKIELEDKIDKAKEEELA